MPRSTLFIRTTDRAALAGVRRKLKQPTPQIMEALMRQQRRTTAATPPSVAVQELIKRIPPEADIWVRLALALCDAYPMSRDALAMIGESHAANNGLDRTDDKIDEMFFRVWNLLGDCVQTRQVPKPEPTTEG